MNYRYYKQGIDRRQKFLVPPSVESFVSKDNPIRAIEAYVDSLDLKSLSFENTKSNKDLRGHPSFSPGVLLKLYLYGYMQGITSSRKLEKEVKRNLEVIWLLADLKPSYKTISDFRKSNSNQLKSINKDFILLCKELKLIEGKSIAIDGSFFKGDVSSNNIYTEEQLDKSIEKIEKNISKYHDEIEKEDLKSSSSVLELAAECENLAEKIEHLKEIQSQKKALREKLSKSDRKQIAIVDEDASLLSKRGTTVAGYNVQLSVDDKFKLIVGENVVQDGNDVHQLCPMISESKDILDLEGLDVYADSGYYESNALKKCEDTGVKAYIAIPSITNEKNKDKFSKLDFKFDEESSLYKCPNGMVLMPKGKKIESKGKLYISYETKITDCSSCPLQTQCLGKKSKRKRIRRWEHEEVLENHRLRMNSNPDSMKKRGGMVEHLFGTLKSRASGFLLRGLEKCRGEFSLMCVCYNFTRVLNILKVEDLVNYLKTRNKVISI